MKKSYISTSVLAADKTKLIDELKRCENSNIDFIHFDVMDNKFVPNTSFDDDTFEKVRKHCSLLFEVHLMVNNPYDYIDRYEYNNDDVIIVHYEQFATKEDLYNCILYIKNNHRVGVSIKPATDVRVLDDFLHLLDYVLIMSVEPGFGGQKFMPIALDKIKYLSDKQDEYNFLIEVDGGINDITYKDCLLNGCDILVSGSYLFKGDMKLNQEKIR